MQIANGNSIHKTYAIESIFQPPSKSISESFKTRKFQRKTWRLCDLSTVISDRFPDIDEAACSFFRISSPSSQILRFTVKDINQIESCSAGGWLLKPNHHTSPIYWLPQAPILRTLDSNGRILSETPIAIVGIRVLSQELIFEIETEKNTVLDLTLWRFISDQSDFESELKDLLVLEKQSIFCWNSQTTYTTPSDLYRYLINGTVYTERFIWPRMWKIGSELDAYTLYVAMNGLELATAKKLYGLFKRQLVFSVIGRQEKDGGWYHGEWTDLMESHYRFHNGALLLLSAALEEEYDQTINDSLRKGAYFISLQVDQTDIGTWFLHDSLEKSPEMMDQLSKQTGSRWIPSRILGKSPTNKLILNTHLDSVVALCRYQEVTGDNQYSQQIASARSATKALLSLRPAEILYRLLYRLIDLTLLPASEAERLPLMFRALKRLTWMYISPNFYRLKRLFPRLVMPSGLIERHLSMPHSDFNYPAVNIMDLTRLQFCHPEEYLTEISNKAVKAIVESSITKYWAESKPGNRQQFALVVWIEALCNLCTLSRDLTYRRYIAEAIICAVDNGLGLPPVTLGGNPEATKVHTQKPCPSPNDHHLRVANLSCEGHLELLVVNSSENNIDLIWQRYENYNLAWKDPNGQLITTANSKISVPPRSWLLGLEVDRK